MVKTNAKHGVHQGFWLPNLAIVICFPFGSSYEFVVLPELQFLYLDRIHPSTIFQSYGTGRIDWIYCFLCFRPPAHRGLRPGGTKQRKGNPAFSGKEKTKKPVVLLPKILRIL